MTVLNAAAPVEVQPGDGGAIRLLTIAGAGFAALTAMFYVWKLSWTGQIPRDGSTLVIGRDFLNFWMYGRAAWLPEPSRFYDPHLYNDALAALLGPDYPRQNWSYPPTIMLLAAPFGRIGYFAALALWTVRGFRSSPRWRAAACDRRLLIPILCSPAAVFCLISGQSSFLTAAMLLTIMALLDRRPVLAGILIGLLTLKPQLGLLFPVLLAASGRWRVFAVAGITALLLAAAATAVFGPQVWIDFVQKGPAGAEPRARRPGPDRHAILSDDLYELARRRRELRRRHDDPGHTSQPWPWLPYFLPTGCARTPTRNCSAPCSSRQRCARCLISCPTTCSRSPAPPSMLLARGKLDTTGQTLAKLVYWLPLIQMIFGQYHLPGPAFILPAFAAFLLMRVLKPSADRGIMAFL